MSQPIQFVDQTIGDGRQSLWDFTMRTDMVVPITETADRAGYRNIDIAKSEGAEVIASLMCSLSPLHTVARTPFIGNPVIIKPAGGSAM
jgi:pyruvate/oxaloacetate carboxyltransferase